MKVEFENTFSDVLKFNASHQFRNIPLQAVFIGVCALIFFSEYSYDIETDTRSSLPEALMVALIWYIGIWLFQNLFNVIYLYSRKNKSVLTRHVVELRDDSFYEETPYNKSYYYWNGIVKIIRTSGFIAVYVSPHMAVIIPNRAFRDTQQCEIFFNKLMELYRNA